MKFLDYEKIIRDSYPMLIESYVEQYGEEYREHITSVLDRIKYCFYVTPYTLREYVHRRNNEDFFRAVIEFYANYGIDVSKMAIDIDNLEFYDNAIENFTYALFPWLEDGLFNGEIRGIYSFNEKYDSLDFNDPIIQQRIILLEKILKKEKDVSFLDYYNSDNYKKDCLLMREILNSFNSYFDKYSCDDYSEVLEYANELEKKIYLIGLRLEKEFMIDICNYLCSEDVYMIESGQDFDVRDLVDYRNIFNIDSIEASVAFSEGPLDYFCDKYDSILADADTDITLKKEIVAMRFRFLGQHGFDTSSLNIDDLYCDWYSLECFKGELPDKSIVEEIVSLKSDYVSLFNCESAKLCVINDYEIDATTAEVLTITESDGHSCSVDVDHLDDYTKPVPVVCLCPLDEIYNLIDVSIDHELRHAIETKIKEVEGGYVIKIGTNVSAFLGAGGADWDNYVSYNELVTEKLAVEATTKRWQKGQFILSDKFALMTIYPSASYDYAFENFDILFDEFRDEMIICQMSDDFDKIFELFPKEDMDEMDSIVFKLSEDTKETLRRIRDRNKGNKTLLKKK